MRHNLRCKRCWLFTFMILLGACSKTNTKVQETIGDQAIKPSKLVATIRGTSFFELESAAHTLQRLISLREGGENITWEHEEEEIRVFVPPRGEVYILSFDEAGLQSCFVVAPF